VTEGQWQLTEAERREIERLRKELGTSFCQHCDYCQPCPDEIPISTVMDIRSLTKSLPKELLFSGEPAEAMEKAAYCTQCGQCEERCPFNLNIMDTLAEQVRWYQQEQSRHRQQVSE